MAIGIRLVGSSKGMNPHVALMLHPCCTLAALYGGAGLAPIAQLLLSDKGGIGIFGETLDIAFWARLPEGCKLGMLLNRIETELND